MTFVVRAVVDDAAAAGVLDQVDVAERVGDDSLIARAAHRAVEELQRRRFRAGPAQRRVDHRAAVAGLAGEQHLPVERVIGGAVDAAEAGQAGAVGAIEQRDPVLGIGDVEVDPGQIRFVGAVLVALDQEVGPVVVAGGRPAGVGAGDQVGVLVGLGAGPRQRVGVVVQVAVGGVDRSRILQRVIAGGDGFGAEAGCEQIRRGPCRRLRRGNAGRDLRESDACRHQGGESDNWDHDSAHVRSSSVGMSEPRGKLCAGFSIPVTCR